MCRSIETHRDLLLYDYERLSHPEQDHAAYYRRIEAQAKMADLEETTADIERQGVGKRIARRRAKRRGRRTLGPQQRRGAAQGAAAEPAEPPPAASAARPKTGTQETINLSRDTVAFMR